MPSYVTSSNLTEHLKDSDVGCRKLPGQLIGYGFRLVLIKHVDHQRAADFLVAAAQLLFLRHRHAGGIERDPYFAAGDRCIGRQLLNNGGQARFIRRLIEPGGDGKGAAELAAPHGAAAPVRFMLMKTFDMTSCVIGVG